MGLVDANVFEFMSTDECKADQTSLKETERRFFASGGPDSMKLVCGIKKGKKQLLEIFELLLFFDELFDELYL